MQVHLTRRKDNGVHYTKLCIGHGMQFECVHV